MKLRKIRGKIEDLSSFEASSCKKSRYLLNIVFIFIRKCMIRDKCVFIFRIVDRRNLYRLNIPIFLLQEERMKMEMQNVERLFKIHEY